MITLILQSSLCWSVFLLIYQLFLRKETFFRFNRYYLVVTLILGGMIPMLRMLWEKLNPVPIEISFTTWQGTAQILEIVSTGKAGTDWLKWINLIYWMGVIVCLALLLRQVTAILSILKKYPKQKFQDYTLVSTDYAHLPYSFMGYVFISKVVEFKDEEMNRILKHEVSHVHGSHSLDIVLVELIKDFAWFSPLVYWYKQTIRNTHEYLADALVLKSTDTNSYGLLLINNAQQGLQIALANHFIYSQLKNRINMMMQSPSKRTNVWKYALILPVLFILAVMFAYKSDRHYDMELNSNLQIANQDSIPKQVLYFLNGEISTPEEIRNILPQQITSMNVIKEKEALKSFGEEGKNGVIQISTRTLYLVNDIESTKEETDKIAPNDIESMDVIKYGKSTQGIIKITLKNKLSPASTQPVRFVQQMPQFPGGDAAMLKYLAENIKYPKEAKDKNIQGRLIMEFIVGADGSIAQVKVVRSVGAGCDEEGIRVLNKMNEDGLFWKPGINDGTKVPVIYTLPIAFRLANSKMVDSEMPPPPPIIDEFPGRNSNDLTTPPPPPPVILNPKQEVDEMAQFPGGQEKLFSFISEHLRYPLIAKDSSIQGRVVVSFIVGENGSIYNTKLLKGIGGGCDEESVRMVNSMNQVGIRWVPAKVNGKSVASEYTLPLSFKLLGILKVIPNPARQQVEINYTQGKDINIDIIDLNGRVVYHQDIMNFDGTHNVDVSRFVKGAYIVRLKTNDTSEEQKLVLQ